MDGKPFTEEEIVDLTLLIKANRLVTRLDVFGRYAFEWKGQRVSVPMVGRHAVSNALLALTVAEILGVPARDAVRGLSEAEAGAMRGELRRVGDLTLIVDCYNANPQSVRAALDVLEDQGVAARKVAVLGSMLELGSHADELHDRVLADALERDLDVLVATGLFAEAAGRSGVTRDSTGTPRLVVAEILAPDRIGATVDRDLGPRAVEV